MVDPTPRGRCRAAMGLLCSALLMVGCAQAAAPPTPTAVPPTLAPMPSPVATTSVKIENFLFAPAAITVGEGSTVTWTNNDVEQHTATAKDRAFNSDIIANAKSFSFTFSKAGTYQYACLIHPNMVGNVVVVAK